MTTPEGRVKDRIKKVLVHYGAYYFMPVQTGRGASGLDFHCVIAVRGVPVAFFVEGKDAGKLPTERQDDFIKDRWRYQRARTFVVDGDRAMRELIAWLERMKALDNERTGKTTGDSRLPVPGEHVPRPEADGGPVLGEP